MTTTAPSPDVLMLMASGCAFCPAVKQILQQLKEEGQIHSLEIINISEQPEVAAQYGVRSVPFIKIGDIHLTGSQTRDEILRAIEQSQSDGGLVPYYDDLLNNGQLNEAIEHIQAEPARLSILLEMIKDPNIKISTQVGIGAIFESFAETAALQPLIPALTELTRHSLPRVRNDACHFLSLTGQQEVIPAIEKLLQDEDAEVRETASDCLQELAN